MDTSNTNINGPKAVIGDNEDIILIDWSIDDRI